MVSPLILQDLSGLSEGIAGAGSALAQALGQRQESQKKANQQTLLSQTLQGADLNTPQGQISFLQNWQKAGGDIKDAALVIKNVAPSPLQNFLQGEGVLSANPQPSLGGGSPATQGMNVGGNLPQEGEPSLSNQPPQMGTGFQPQQEEVPAYLKGSPLANIPEETITKALGSDNKQVREWGEGMQKSRDAQFNQWAKNREHAYKRNQKFFDDITNKKQVLDRQEILVENLKRGLLNREPGEDIRDFVAAQFGDIGERFLTPEGTLANSAVKEYLIADLANVKGRPNIYLEQRITSALPNLNKTVEANETLVNHVEMKQALDRAYIDTFMRESEFYQKPENGGFEPPNFISIVDQKAKAEQKRIRDLYAYKSRLIEEKHKGVDELYKKKANGAIWTKDMRNKFVYEYATKRGKTKEQLTPQDKQKIIEKAKKQGYVIPKQEEYQSWQRQM